MKHLLLLLFVAITALDVTAQTTVIRRITATTQTIPYSDTIAGKVWTDSSDATYKTLQYVGGVNLDSLWRNANIGKSGYYWIYVPGATTTIAKVMDVDQNGVDSFQVTVDRAMTAVVNRSVKSINGKFYAYEFTNDGDTTGTANGVIIKPGDKVRMPFSWIQGTGINWQEPVEIVGTLTDFLIVEKH